MINLLLEIGVNKLIISLGLAVVPWAVGRVGNERSKGGLEAVPLNGKERP